MAVVTADFMMSLDGYIAGPNVSPTNPAGDGAEVLMGWMHEIASWRRRQGMEGGETGVDSDVLQEWFDAPAAVIMGRTMYDSGADFWGDTPPFCVPVFVLTHRPKDRIETANGTSFTFVTDGIASALDSARSVAGNGVIDISGGASTAQQYMVAGLVDELQVHIVPHLMGRGLRLFDNLGDRSQALEPVRILQGERAVHLKYRFRRR